jgi:uncharacterized protein (TIGR00255 family)
MTGFGRAEGSLGGKKISIELRALNSKGLDLSLRFPPIFREMDNEFRKEIGSVLVRGKIDCNLNMEFSGEQEGSVINKELAKRYLIELKELAAEMSLPDNDLISVAMRMPEVVDAGREELSEEDKRFCKGVLRDAINELNTFREKEGSELEDEFRMRIGEIRDALNLIPKYEQERLDVVRERIRKGLEELGTNYDSNRFEQELIFYIEKLDVSEEKMRLGHHLNYFEETMATDEPGKKLGFIAQEIGREVNTLGSKSNHAEMQKLVIGMKDALEKIKEQILNTL